MDLYKLNKMNNTVENRNERLKTIDIIFELFPELKKNKDEIMMNVLEKYGRPFKYILNKHIYKNQVLYIDEDGFIFDNDVNFIGLYVNNVYFLLNDNFDIIPVEKYDKLFQYKK
jgi:hypothetical protein